MELEKLKGAKTGVVTGALAVALISLLVVQVSAQQDRQNDQQDERLTYSVKFVCGSIPGTGDHIAAKEPPVKPGNYATAINIHNFGEEESGISVNAALSTAIINGDEVTTTRSRQRERGLGPGEATEVDCQDIMKMFSGDVAEADFAKGFVTLKTREKLSVASVYTSEKITKEEEIVSYTNLNTGYNEETGELIPFGEPDDDWEFVNTSEDLETGDAIVWNPGDHHSALEGTRWISIDSDGGSDVVGGFNPNKEPQYFDYQTEFELPASCENPELDLEFKVDDTTAVFLNGNPIAGQGTTSNTRLEVTDASLFRTGKNTLTFRVKDGGGVVTGLDVDGTASCTKTETTGAGMSTDVEYVDPFTRRGR